jgi:hypothetical protein
MYVGWVGFRWEVMRGVGGGGGYTYNTHRLLAYQIGISDIEHDDYNSILFLILILIPRARVSHPSFPLVLQTLHPK